jgi:hypothetical protein
MPTEIAPQSFEPQRHLGGVGIHALAGRAFLIEISLTLPTKS